MKNKYIRTIYRKEWQELFPIWLALLLGGFTTLFLLSWIQDLLDINNNYMSLDFTILGALCILIYVYVTAAITFVREVEENNYQFLRRLPIPSSVIFWGKVRAIFESTLLLILGISLLFPIIPWLFDNAGYFHREFYMARLATGIPIAFLLGLYLSMHEKRQWNTLITGTVLYLLIDLIFIPIHLPFLHEFRILPFLFDPFRIFILLLLLTLVLRDSRCWFDLVEADDKGIIKNWNNKMEQTLKNPEVIQKFKSRKRPWETSAFLWYSLRRFSRVLFWSFILLIFLFCTTWMTRRIDNSQSKDLFSLILIISGTSFLMFFWSLLPFTDISGSEGQFFMKIGANRARIWFYRFFGFGSLFLIGLILCNIVYFQIYEIDAITAIKNIVIYSLFSMDRSNYMHQVLLELYHNFYILYPIFFYGLLLPLLCYAVGSFFSIALRGLPLAFGGTVTTMALLWCGNYIFIIKHLYEPLLLLNLLLLSFFVYQSWHILRIRLRSREENVFNGKFFGLLAGIILFWWFTAPSFQLLFVPLQPDYQVVYEPNSQKEPFPFLLKEMKIPIKPDKEPDKETIQRQKEILLLLNDKNESTQIIVFYHDISRPNYDIRNAILNQKDLNKLTTAWNLFLKLYQETELGYLTYPLYMKYWIANCIGISYSEYNQEQCQTAIRLLQRISQEIPSNDKFFRRSYIHLIRIQFEKNGHKEDLYYHHLVWNFIQTQRELADKIYQKVKVQTPTIYDINMQFQQNKTYSNTALSYRYNLNNVDIYNIENILKLGPLLENRYRALIIQLAIRLYQMKNDNKYPETLLELVEKGYIKDLPKPSNATTENPDFIYSVKMEIPQKRTRHLVNYYPSQQKDFIEYTTRYKIPSPIVISKYENRNFNISRRFNTTPDAYNPLIPYTKSADNNFILTEYPAIFEKNCGFFMELRGKDITF